MKKLTVFHRQQGKLAQPVMIAIVIGLTVLAAIALYIQGKNQPAESADEAEEKGSLNEAEGGHEEEEAVVLTPKQLTEQGIQIAAAELGEVVKTISYPAKLTANTDRQAHVSPSFNGVVESVAVDLGQQVQKGQILAVLMVPDLVDQQSNLQMQQSNLQLAEQDYLREKALWSQGISAKQDYQRAYNAYRQAQIQLQASKSRLSAFGAQASSNGRFILKAPISGAISKKDLAVGEFVQLSDQLFTIDQLDQLWLEFILPSSSSAALAPNQSLQFKSLQSGKVFKAQVQSLVAEADAQTGRLQVRAKVMADASELRPNLMVNVLVQQGAVQAVRVLKTAVQNIEGKDAVFTAVDENGKLEFKAQPVVLGQTSSDGKWIEVQSGLSQGQRYAAQGSFLLKSEMEKGEASHAH